MKNLGWLERLTPFDRKLLVIVSILVALSFSILFRQSNGARIIVTANDKTVFVAPLNKDQQVELEGPLGITVLQIKNGVAQIISSPCPRKVCISMGNAQHTGDLLACVPNQLVIRIEGEKVEDAEYDFIKH